MPTPSRIILTLFLAMLGALPISTQANEATWQALQEGGLVILMRHSLAPGVGDPPGFELSRCDTQRNLSPQGRTQAQAIGSAFREREVPIASVYSSRWCRALDTAELMTLGLVEPVSWLNSFFRGRGDRALITQTAQEEISAWQGPGNLLLVTHQVNITALVGSGVGSGEMIVVRPAGDEMQDESQIVGRLNASQ